MEQQNLAVMASKHTANSETQVKSCILSNAEKEIISSTTDACSNVMLTCNKESKTKMAGQYKRKVVLAGILIVISRLSSSTMWHGVISHKHINVLPPASSEGMWLNNSRRETTLATVTCHKAPIHTSCISKLSYIECRKCHIFVSYCHSASDLSVLCFCCNEATGVWQFVMKLLVCHSL